jgi:signal transduction histidine kinase
VLAGGLYSLKRQRVVFAVLDLSLLAILLFLHATFASFWGKPSTALAELLGVCFVIRAGEVVWLRGRVLQPRASAWLTGASIAFNLLVAFILATVIDREDSQYFALLVVPVLESAFRFGLRSTIAVVAVADGVAFYWVWRYFHAHPPTDVGEYFEAGTISIIFLIVGVLTSVMIGILRRNQEQLEWNVSELERTRARLLKEETLAAVGRIASAVSHEIRNPAAMISSSLATAQKLTGSQRDEMLAIAGKEAERLVSLTSDLLAYARPRRPALVFQALRDTLLNVAATCRAHAETRGISLRVAASGEVTMAHDQGLVQQVLLNLVMNAVDASPPRGTVELALTTSADDEIRIDVENAGGPIPPSVAARLFEPFFTTKPAGTGLGLATAHSVALAQGADLALTLNSTHVRFSLIFPAISGSRKPA